MRNILLTALLTLVFTVNVFTNTVCGVPSLLQGQVTVNGYPKSNAVVSVYSLESGELSSLTRTNGFGYYQTIMDSCPQSYQIIASTKSRDAFHDVILYVDGSGDTNTVDFLGVSANTYSLIVF